MAASKAPKLGGQASVALPEDVFGEPFHGAIVYETARAEQLARRRGTASTLTRAEVRGGGAKPWRQKGTGRARAGSIRLPHWPGGGVAFGPRPRRYTTKVNRKARRRALRAALTLHRERESIAVVEASDFDPPSTRKAHDALVRWDAERPVLVVLVDGEEACSKSFRNIDRVSVQNARDVGVADVLGAASIVVSSGALDVLAQLAGAQPAASSEKG
jgi:large subunit ribosomal protein L4